jgi:integrase
MASIRPRGQGFEVRWRDINGVSQRELVYTEKAAKIKKKEVELAILQGKQRRADITKTTFADFVYLHWQQTLMVRATTLSTYNNALVKYILPVFGNVVMTDITSIEIEKWRSSMLKGQLFVAKPLAPKTVERIVNVMAAVMKKAEASKFIDESPFVHIKRAKAKARNKPMHLEFDQYQQVVEQFTESNRLLLHVMFHTGLRPSEALGLTWDRIDLEAMEMTIDRQLSRDVLTEVFCPPKTEASIRKARFGQELKALLIEHREKYGEGPHGLLTSSRMGGIYLYQAASQTFNKIARTLGLPVGSGLHMLRHTYVSQAIAAGANIKEIQVQLGHTSITETMDTYGHLFVENREDFVKRLDEEYRKRVLAHRTSDLKRA